MSLFRNLVLAALVAGCATVGQGFDAGAIARLQPGQTTIDGAAQLLGAPATSTVRHDNGTVTQSWQHIAAGPLGVSANRSMTLIFGPDGKLVRAGHLVNVPISDADRTRLQVMAESKL